MIRGMGYYRRGQLVDVNIDIAGELPGDGAIVDEMSALVEQARVDDDAFLWLGLLQPTKPEISAVAEILKLDPLLVEDALNPRQRTKLDVRQDQTFLVLKVINYIDETSSLETGQLAVFVGNHFVLTIRLGPVGDLRPVREELESSPELLKYGPSAVLYALLDSVVDGYLSVTDEIAIDIEELEEQVFSPDPTDPGMVYRLKRENLELRRAAVPLIGISAELSEIGGDRIPKVFLPLFEDINDHVLRVRDSADTNDNLLITLLMATTARSDLQQNSDMRKISAWVAIAAVPTMIAGIYGMNFDFMPELHWRFGYLLVIGGMATVAFLMFRAFKRSGWL